MIGDARFGLRVSLSLIALLTAACSSGGAKPHPSSEPRTSPAGAAGTEAPSPGPVPGAFVRTCETRVSGGLGPGWREDRSAVVVGPIGFLYPGGYADSRPRLFSRNAEGYSAQKVLVVVEPGAVVTVAIAPTATGASSLLYDPSRFNDTNRYEVSDGESAVTFQACGKGGTHVTQFNGGFIVAGPRCVPLEISTANDGTPRRRVLSFGKGDCA
jgi:hypothetical protein